MTCFLPVPVDGREAKGHDETVRRYQVPVDGSEVSSHDEIVLVASKKQGASAVAGSPMKTLSRETKLSRCTEVNKWLKFFSHRL